MKRLDHLLIGTRDLAGGVAWIAERLGVKPVFGGRHPHGGTANYLLSLGPDIYLEVIGPDPEADPGSEPPPFGIETLLEPRIVTWAAKGSGIESLVAAASADGVPLGQARAGSRTRPDGAELTWELSDPAPFPCDGLVPFFIDWGDTPHPSTSAPEGGELISLRAEHPEPGEARRMLAALDLDLTIEDGPTPALVARIRTASGAEVELR